MKRLLPIALLFLPAWLATAAAEEIVAEQLDRLLRGEAVLLDTESDAAGGAARVQILVHGPARAVWEVITSCELAFVFVDGIQTCEVLEDSGDRAVVHQVVKKGWPVPTQDFKFESLRDPYEEIRFALIEGNLKAMEGSWRFVEIQEGLLVDYRIRVEPGVPAPRFMVRRNIRKGMPDLAACIRGLAGGSGSEAMKAEDLDRCPGEPQR